MTDEELQSLRERAETTLGSGQDLLFGPAVVTDLIDELDYTREILRLARVRIGQWHDEYLGEGRIPSVIDYFNLMKFIDPALTESEEL